jgi:V8-like Glu-specific endopeptidase
MQFSRSLPWKVAAGVGAVTISALIAAAGASASPASLASVAVPSGHLSGAAGQTAGALVPASPKITAYWNSHATTAKVLGAPAPAASRSASATAKLPAATTPRVSAPQGPAVKIAGAAPKVATARAATPARAALGGTGTPWWGSYWSAPATTTGKIFFSDRTGHNWVCSGSLVNSPAQNVVITAGHCVYGTAGGELPAGETWHSNWVFAPDYSYGYAPYGYFSARQLWTLTNYINNGDEQDDLGAAILNRNSAGQNAVALLGGQGIAWNQNSTQYVYDFGYPAGAPFNGQSLQECDGTASWNGWPWVDMEMLNCNFTGGSSGGPWLMAFNGQWGYINSVNDANGYFAFGGQMGGLYFGNNAGNLYNTVANI